MRGAVPAEPFRRLLKRRIEVYDAEYGTDAEGLGTLSGKMIVANETGLNVRQIDRVLNESQIIEWGTADAIVTRTEGAMLWHTDPELHQIFVGVDFVGMDIIKPLDNPGAIEWVREAVLETYDRFRNKKRAAKALDIPYGTYVVRLDDALRAAGRQDEMAQRDLVCKYGHEKAVVGILSNGQCRGCVNERNAQRNRKKEAA